MLASALALVKSCWVAKVRKNLFQKFGKYLLFANKQITTLIRKIDFVKKVSVFGLSTSYPVDIPRSGLESNTFG